MGIIRARIPKGKTQKWRVRAYVKSSASGERVIAEQTYIISATSEEYADLEARVRLLRHSREAAYSFLIADGGALLGSEVELLNPAPRKDKQFDALLACAAMKQAEPRNAPCR